MGSNSGIIGHLYIFKLYRISANHTNVQLSPKKAICEIFAFLELRHRKSQNPFGISITTITISCSALVFAYLFIIICTDPMYVTVYDSEIFRESSQMTVQPIMHRL